MTRDCKRAFAIFSDHENVAMRDSGTGHICASDDISYINISQHNKSTIEPPKLALKQYVSFQHFRGKNFSRMAGLSLVLPLRL